MCIKSLKQQVQETTNAFCDASLAVIQAVEDCNAPEANKAHQRARGLKEKLDELLPQLNEALQAKPAPTFGSVRAGSQTD